MCGAFALYRVSSERGLMIDHQKEPSVLAQVFAFLLVISILCGGIFSRYYFFRVAHLQALEEEAQRR